jgi:hypothetical protein
MCFDGAAQKGLALHQAEGLRCRGTRVILAREVGQTSGLDHVCLYSTLFIHYNIYRSYPLPRVAFAIYWLSRFGEASHANGHDDRSRHREV